MEAQAERALKNLQAAADQCLAGLPGAIERLRTAGLNAAAAKAANS